MVLINLQYVKLQRYGYNIGFSFNFDWGQNFVIILEQDDCIYFFY